MSDSSSIPNIPSITFNGLSQSQLGNIAPEPQSSLSGSFGSVLKSTASSLLEGGASILGGNSEYGALLQMQLQAQREMQIVSMISNVEKSKHETQMAAIRNIRVG